MVFGVATYFLPTVSFLGSVAPCWAKEGEAASTGAGGSGRGTGSGGDPTVPFLVHRGHARHPYEKIGSGEGRHPYWKIGLGAMMCIFFMKT